MSEIVKKEVKVTTTGSAGSATGSGVSGVIHGLLMDIFIDYDGSAPNTTDVTISFNDEGGNILVVSNNEVDGLFAPRQGCVDNANAALSTTNVPFTVHGLLSVAVAGCDALTDAVRVVFKYLTD